MSNLLLLTNDRRIRWVDFPPLTDKNDSHLPLYYRHLECNTIDIVTPYGLEKKDTYCLIVDDEGLLVSEPRINILGSLLYGVLDHHQILAGHVLVGKNLITDDGIETVGLEKEDKKYLINALYQLESKFIQSILKEK